MLKAIFLVATFALISATFAQDQYINVKKSLARKTLLHNWKESGQMPVIKETDSTLHYSSKGADPGSDFDEIVCFDNEGKCNRVILIYGCDSCYQLRFRQMASLKRFKWTKIMDGMYISKYSKKLLLYKNQKHGFSYILQHNKFMTRKQYEELTHNMQ